MKKNKLNLLFATVGCATILIVGGLVFNQIYKNHQVNELIIEKCFEKFDSVEAMTIEKSGLLSSVSCNK